MLCKFLNIVYFNSTEKHSKKYIYNQNPEIRNILGPVQSQFAAYTQHLSQFQALEGKLKAVLVKRENEQKFVKNEKDDERPELFPDHEYGKILNFVFNPIFN